MIEPIFKIFPQQLTEDLCKAVDDEEKGRIYTTRQGVAYSSITTILSKTLSKEKSEILKSWKERVGEEEAEAIKDYAAERGGELHSIVEDYLLGKDYSKKLLTSSKAVPRLFNQVKPIVTKRINNIRLIEKPLYSTGLKVAGRVDLIAEFDNKLSIIDFKTSTKVKTIDMIEDYFIQETAYAVMYMEHFGEKIEQLVTIIATENSLKPYVYTKTPIEYLDKLTNRVKMYYKEETNGISNHLQENSNRRDSVLATRTT